MGAAGPPGRSGSCQGDDAGPCVSAGVGAAVRGRTETPGVAGAAERDRNRGAAEKPFASGVSVV